MVVNKKYKLGEPWTTEGIACAVALAFLMRRYGGFPIIKSYFLESGLAKDIFDMVKGYETPKDQFIQLEGGKLNITKSKELGLFIEDKKVFKWDKSYKEIQYKDYTICGTYEYIRIYKGCNKILVMVEPSIDKVRKELHYYGIEVEVQ